MFCYKCADQFYPLPKFNLTAPVRVCHSCELAIGKQHQQTPTSSSSKSRHMSNSSASGLGHNNNKQYAAYSNSPSSLIFSSTPPFSDLLSGHATSNNTTNTNGKPKLLNPIYSNSANNTEFNNQISSPNNSYGGGRCNQNLDLNKFKKNGENKNSQKVSV